MNTDKAKHTLSKSAAELAKRMALEGEVEYPPNFAATYVLRDPADLDALREIMQAPHQLVEVRVRYVGSGTRLRKIFQGRSGEYADYSPRFRDPRPFWERVRSVFG